MKWPRVSILLLALLFCLPAQAQERKTYTVPFRSVNSLILLDGQLNGKPATLILDTGAQLSLLDSGLAGIPKQKEGQNIGGVIDRSKLVRVGSFCIGARCFSGRTFGVVDYEKISRILNVHIDGQLGQDILREFSSVRIDYKAQTVTLAE